MLITGVAIGYLIDKWEKRYRRNLQMKLSEDFLEKMEKRQKDRTD